MREIKALQVFATNSNFCNPKSLQPDCKKFTKKIIPIKNKKIRELFIFLQISRKFSRKGQDNGNYVLLRYEIHIIQNIL